MAEFPTAFAEEPQLIVPGMLDEVGNAAVEQLAARDFEVVAGVRRADVPEITAIANQDGVLDFCPKDAVTRFPDADIMEENWLPKAGGRGMILLRRRLGRIAGYGWTGIEPCEQLPDCTTTFAERLDERVAGQGLAAPFAVAIVSGSMAIFGAEKIGLETWGSNTAAVRTYLKAGARLVTTKDDRRPTTHPAPNETDGKRRDTRLYMQFDQTFHR